MSAMRLRVRMVESWRAIVNMYPRLAIMMAQQVYQGRAQFAEPAAE
jgi:hypothetical protein